MAIAGLTTTPTTTTALAIQRTTPPTWRDKMTVRDPQSGRTTLVGRTSEGYKGRAPGGVGSGITASLGALITCPATGVSSTLSATRQMFAIMRARPDGHDLCPVRTATVINCLVRLACPRAEPRRGEQAGAHLGEGIRVTMSVTFMAQRVRLLAGFGRLRIHDR